MADEFTAKLQRVDELVRKLEAYRKASRLTMYEVLIHQGRNFAIQATKEAIKISPRKESLRKFLFALSKRGQLKIKQAGRTAKQEIARRIAAIGSIRLGFSCARRNLKGVSEAYQLSRSDNWRTGAVEIHLEGEKPYITATNKMAGILAAERKHHIIRRTIARLLADIQVYLDRKTREAKAAAGLDDDLASG